MLIENKKNFMKKEGSSNRTRTDTMATERVYSGKRVGHYDESLVKPTKANMVNWLSIKENMKHLHKMATNIDTMYPLGVCGYMSAETRAPDEKQSSLKNTRTLYDMINARMFDPIHPIPLGTRVPAKTKIPAATKTTMAKIRCGRIMINDAKMIEIREFIGFIQGRHLPCEYLDGTPRISYEVDSIGRCVVINENEDDDWIMLHVGDRISYKEYVRLLKIMTKAGQRLTDINAKAKRAQEFSGEFTVTI